MQNMSKFGCTPTITPVPNNLTPVPPYIGQQHYTQTPNFMTNSTPNLQSQYTINQPIQQRQQLYANNMPMQGPQNEYNNTEHPKLPQGRL